MPFEITISQLLLKAVELASSAHAEYVTTSLHFHHRWTHAMWSSMRIQTGSMATRNICAIQHYSLSFSWESWDGKKINGWMMKLIAHTLRWLIQKRKQKRYGCENTNANSTFPFGCFLIHSKWPHWLQLLSFFHLFSLYSICYHKSCVAIAGTSTQPVRHRSEEEAAIMTSAM